MFDKQTDLLQKKSNPSCIDLLLATCFECFQNSNFEKGISDFYKMVITVMRTTY